MTTTMSLAARRDMLLSIWQRYLSEKRPEKTRILQKSVELYIFMRIKV